MVMVANSATLNVESGENGEGWTPSLYRPLNGEVNVVSSRVASMAV